ncbi:hypothetical protein THOD04_250044 [Vibrio owensii]|nr:hypothetical protein THOD04_250044 [Vibrio owensii]
MEVATMTICPIQHWCYREPARMSHDINTRFYVAKVEREGTLKKIKSGIVYPLCGGCEPCEFNR